MRELQLQSRKPGGDWGCRNRFGTFGETPRDQENLAKARIQAQTALFGWARIDFQSEFRVELVPYVPPVVNCGPPLTDLDAYRRWVARREMARLDDDERRNKSKAIAFEQAGRESR